MTVGERAAVVILLAGAGSFVAAACTRAAGPTVPFAVATVHFEQNATDGDVEVVFDVKGGDDGLSGLIVTAPDGRRVVAITAPDATTMGLRQFRFESPEPTDVDRLKAAYPAGVYRFAGTTASGDRYAGEATLSHDLPPAASVVTPADEAEGVPLTGLRITWTPVPDVDHYVVTLEQSDLGFELTVTLPGSAGSFAVPDGVLEPGHEYTLALGTVHESGNASFVETSFTTADKE